LEIYPKEEKYCNSLCGNTETKYLLCVCYKCKLEDNTKPVCKEIGYVIVDWIHVTKIGGIVGLTYTPQKIYWLSKLSKIY
jgi:hypothetical protein